jgi:Holliday junction resolvase
MPSKSKGIGDRWERELAKLLLDGGAAQAKRIPGSGSLGTTLQEARLTADVFAKYKFLNRPLKIEAKYGYGGLNQMAIKREWMEKVRMQALGNNSIPAVALKFRDVISGDRESAKWICFSIEDWNKLVGELNDLFDDLEDYWEYKYRKDK